MAEGVDIENEFRNRGFSDPESDEDPTTAVQEQIQSNKVEEDDLGVSVERKMRHIEEITVSITESTSKPIPEIIVEDDINGSIDLKPRTIPQIKLNDVDTGGAAALHSEAVSDFTIEDDETYDGLSTLVSRCKTTKAAARNYSEVFAKRRHPAERMSSVPAMSTSLKLTATRSSISRQGSRVQVGPRVKPEVIPSEKSDSFLQSSTRDDEKSKRLKTIIDRSECIIEKHKTKATVLKLNFRGKAYEKTCEVLKEKRLVHITGKLGSGKTHLALDVITSFIEDFEHYRPLIIESPLDLAVLENTASYVIVLADDLVGSGNCREAVANGWRHIMKFVIPLMERKRICFIFTSETTDVDAFAQQTRSFNGLLEKQYLVNLDDVALCFSDKEKDKMLTLYCKHFCKPLYTQPKQIEDFVFAHYSELGFPLICNLVGIGGSSELFSDPYSALYSFVADQEQHHFPSFFLLVLVLITERNCSLLKFQHENQSTYEKLSEIMKPKMCTHSELSIGLTRLKRQNILFEEESGDISFTHELIAAAILRQVFTVKPLDDFISLLPVQVLNTFAMTPDSYFQSSDNNQLESSTEVLRAVVSKFNNALDLKQPKHFLDVASSQIWSFNSFVGTVFTLLGCQFFFVEDVHKTALSSYLVHIGNVAVISKLVDYMRSKPRQIISMTKAAIQKTKEEACRSNERETLNQLLTLCSDTDIAMVHAAIEGGNVDILELTMHQNANDSRMVSREMLQTACKYGHFEVMKYLFSKLVIRLDSTVSKLIEMRKQNSKGETLLHYAAVGGNVSIFEFLLEQKCDPLSRTNEGNTVLHIASMFGRFQLVRFICSRFPNLFREKNQFDFTCVHLAAREGHGDVLQILLSRESNITDQATAGNTILHLAAANGHSEVIRYMQLVNPIQQHTPNNNALLPVHLAVINGLVDTMKLFLQTGTDIMTKTVDKRSFLHLAAFSCQLDMVRYLCTYKPELINELDIEGNTVGHDAAASGNIEVLKYLIDKGFDPLSQNKYKTTLLHEASLHGHLGMVRYLSIKYPDLLSIPNSSGYTVCFGAAVCGHVEVIKFLVDNGADLKRVSVDGSSVLHEAAFSGNFDVVLYLCTYFPELTDARNSKTFMACHFAAQEGHLEVLDVLLRGKTMPLPTTSEKQTLLHIASYNGMIPVVKYLCQKFPAIIPCLDRDRSSAVHYAARGDNRDVLQYLIDQGLDPESSTNPGSTILHLAAYDGNTDMVTFLCSRYPQLIRALDSTGYSAAHYAAGSGEVPLLLNILKYGIDPLLRSSNGSTLLLKAAYNGKFEMVQYLCTEHPELISLSDAFGCNVLHYAACGGNVDLMQYMIDLGVDLKSQTNDGHTMLHVAAFHGQVDLVNHICQEYPSLLNMKDSSGKTAEQTAIDQERKQVVNLFRSLKKPENRADIVSSTGVVTDICCCEGTNCFEQSWRILCCCRR